MGTVVLNVAEKPSVAKEIANILSSGRLQRRNGQSKYNPIFEFDYSINGEQCRMVVTSVAGHIMESDFGPNHRKWSSCPPQELFSAPIVRSVKDDPNINNIVKTLKSESRRAKWLVLWLDCDREGENIAFEVKNCCETVNRRLRVFRAKFSALIPRDIHHAITVLGSPDVRLSDAVDARSEIDLRIGAAFTRFQTMKLQRQFPGLAESVISYGPCQFPTLGFVVDRYLRIEAFEREEFWYIAVSQKQEEPSSPTGFAEVAFMWNRNRLFDRTVCLAIFELCIEQPVARVINLTSRDISRQRPVPLATVELQKRSSRWLRISSEQTMKVAEDLYNRGLISYPRTETEKFKEGTDLTMLIQLHQEHPTWGAYTSTLLNEEKFQWPRNGSNDDQAHPPIHPTKCVALSELRSEEEKKIYELVCRHFLACCSQDARGKQTKVIIDIAHEQFTASGQMITERNYLDIYKYDKWASSLIPSFQEGDEFVPDRLDMKDGMTAPPPLLSESDLIAEMDKHGIGTDATIAEHIKTIQKRCYAIKVNNNTQFQPTPLGLALVKGYDQMGYQLSKPHLRATMEKDCKAIALGQKTKQEVVGNCLQQMRNIFLNVVDSSNILTESVSTLFPSAYTVDERNLHTVQRNFSRCGRCNQAMELRKRDGSNGMTTFLAHCHSCNQNYRLPANGVHCLHDRTCPLCNFQVIQINTGNGYNGNGYTLCPHCYSSPPPPLQNEINMACFKCTEINCSLAMGTDATPVFKCPKCQSNDCILKKTRNGKYVVSCVGFRDNCTDSGIWLPGGVTSCKVLPDTCTSCERNSDRMVQLLRIHFRSGSVPPDVALDFRCCILCNATLQHLMSISGTSPSYEDIGLPRGGNFDQQTHDDLSSSFTQLSRGVMRGASFTRREHNGGHVVDLTVSVLNDNIAPVEEIRSASTSEVTKQASSLSNIPLCSDHRIPCALRVTRKAGANQGREFYTCSLSEAEKCDYFQWLDASFDSKEETPGSKRRKHSDISTNIADIEIRASHSLVPMCPGHDLPCATRVTRKAGPNQGREFYSCSLPADDSCQFFKWVNDHEDNQSTPTTMPRGQTVSRSCTRTSSMNVSTPYDLSIQSKEPQNEPSTTGPPLCPGHNEPCAVRVTRKEGPNQGREFYSCNHPRTEACEFFKWVNEYSPHSPSRPSSASCQTFTSSLFLNVPSCECNVPAKKLVSRQSHSAGREFFKCGQDGNCTFFQWVDELVNDGATSTIPASNPKSHWNPEDMIGNNPESSSSNHARYSHDVAGNGREKPLCPGHNLPCVLRVTRKAGVNQGKHFYTCSLPQGQSCDFFQWKDQ